MNGQESFCHLLVDRNLLDKVPRSNSNDPRFDRTPTGRLHLVLDDEQISVECLLNKNSSSCSAREKQRLCGHSINNTKLDR